MAIGSRLSMVLPLVSLAGMGACAPSGIDRSGDQWLALAVAEEQIYACGHGDEITRVALTAMRECAERALRLDGAELRAIAMRVEEARRRVANQPCGEPSAELRQVMDRAGAEAVALVAAMLELHQRPPHHYPKARAEALLADGGRARIEAWLAAQPSELAATRKSSSEAWVREEREQLARNRSQEFFAGAVDGGAGQSHAVDAVEAMLDGEQWQALSQVARRGGRGIQPWTGLRSASADVPQAIDLMALSFYGRSYPARIALYTDGRVSVLIERDHISGIAEIDYPAVLTATMHLPPARSGQRDPFALGLVPEATDATAAVQSFDGVSQHPRNAAVVMYLRQPKPYGADPTGWSSRAAISPERVVAYFEFPKAAGAALEAQGPAGTATIEIRLEGLDGGHRSAIATLGLVDALAWARR